MNEKSLLLKRNEAAERLRQSVRNIDKLIASGKLPSIRIGRSVLVRESAIEDFIEAHELRGKVNIKTCSES